MKLTTADISVEPLPSVIPTSALRHPDRSEAQWRDPRIFSVAGVPHLRRSLIAAKVGSGGADLNHHKSGCPTSRF
jgi:hypothetical protein